MILKIKRKAGATLTEIMMVVALIALITITALNYFNAASQSRMTQETISNITAVSSAIRNQFATQGDYIGITESVVYNFANVPVMMKGALANQLIHPWSSAATAMTITTVAPNDTFSINMGEISSTTCTDLASKMYRHYEALSVGATPITSVATAQTACSSSATPTLTITVR